MGDSYQAIIGRYALYDEIASGGMATVHIGRLLGPVGFSRTVAIKRLHPQFAKDPEFVDMFVDEARLAARIRHPNVVPTLDVVKTEQELFLVMEYVQGESLSRLMRRARRIGTPLKVRLVAPVAAGLLHGLHAAHVAKGERGEALGIVHRDVSPQNVLVGTDGVTRVFDFGIAKARVRLQTTREGQIKGKLAYMAPEQLSGGEVGPQTDVYAASVVLWEALTNRRLFDADNEAMLLAVVLEGAQHPPSEYNADVSPDLDAIVMRGLAELPGDRFQTAREMARALERCVECASASEIGEWVEELATETLGKRAERIAEIESQSEIKAFAPDTSPSSASGSFRAQMDSSSDLKTPHSQLSSISVAALTRPEKSGRGTTVAIALGALLMGGLGAAIVLRQGTPEPAVGVTSTAPVGPGENAPSATVPLQTQRPSAAPSPPPAASPVPSAELGDKSPTPSASATPSVRVTAGPRPRPLPSPSPQPSASPEPAAKKCAWKKVFDAEGNHTYKEVCE